MFGAANYTIQVVLVYLQPFRRNSVLRCVLTLKIH